MARVFISCRYVLGRAAKVPSGAVALRDACVMKEPVKLCAGEN